MASHGPRKRATITDVAKVAGVVVMVFPDAGDKYLGDRYWEEAA